MNNTDLRLDEPAFYSSTPTSPQDAGSYAVKLGSHPASDVTVRVYDTSDVYGGIFSMIDKATGNVPPVQLRGYVTVDTDTLRFTPGNWNMSQTVSVKVHCAEHDCEIPIWNVAEFGTRQVPHYVVYMDPVIVGAISGGFAQRVTQPDVTVIEMPKSYHPPANTNSIGTSGSGGNPAPRFITVVLGSLQEKIRSFAPVNVKVFDTTLPQTQASYDGTIKITTLNMYDVIDRTTGEAAGPPSLYLGWMWHTGSGATTNNVADANRNFDGFRIGLGPANEMSAATTVWREANFIIGELASATNSNVP